MWSKQDLKTVSQAANCVITIVAKALKERAVSSTGGTVSEGEKQQRYKTSLFQAKNGGWLHEESLHRFTKRIFIIQR